MPVPGLGAIAPPEPENCAPRMGRPLFAEGRIAKLRPGRGAEAELADGSGAGVTRRSRLLAGARDMAPMILGAAPFGFIFGALAASGPLGAWNGLLMSATVFAGASQFVALGLIAAHAGLVLLWLTTLIVNLRHGLYAANLLPHVARLPKRWRLLLAFLLVDEAFALVSEFHRREPQATLGHWYYLGAGLAMYANWLTMTVAGVLVGESFPGLATSGLDFAIVATFVSIVVPQLGERPRLAAALSSAVAAVALHDLPLRLGLLAASAVGIAAGVAALRLRRAARGAA